MKSMDSGTVYIRDGPGGHVMPGSTTGGPVPKPSAQRRRKNKPVVPTDITPASRGELVVDRAPEPNRDWHPIAAEWFDSLARSGQAYWYEPSDWAEARACAELMSKLFSAEKPSAQLAQTVMAWSTNLLTTEGSRRRLRLELARGSNEPSAVEVAAAADLDAYRKRLGGA